MSLLVLFGLAILLVGIAFTWYQLYHLLALDADLRGISHPKGTAFFLSNGQRGEGLLAYPDQPGKTSPQPAAQETGLCGDCLHGCRSLRDRNRSEYFVKKND